jgi:hypothetical protein
VYGRERYFSLYAISFSTAKPGPFIQARAGVSLRLNELAKMPVYARSYVIHVSSVENISLRMLIAPFQGV